MVDERLINAKFHSLEAYNHFCNEWNTVCASLKISGYDLSKIKITSLAYNEDR